MAGGGMERVGGECGACGGEDGGVAGAVGGVEGPVEEGVDEGRAQPPAEAAPVGQRRRRFTHGRHGRGIGIDNGGGGHRWRVRGRGAALVGSGSWLAVRQCCALRIRR